MGWGKKSNFAVEKLSKGDFNQGMKVNTVRDRSCEYREAGVMRRLLHLHGDLPQNESPQFTIRKSSCAFYKTLDQNSSKLSKSYISKEAQTRGTQGDVVTNCNVESWLGSWTFVEK